MNSNFYINCQQNQFPPTCYKEENIRLRYKYLAAIQSQFCFCDGCGYMKANINKGMNSHETVIGKTDDMETSLQSMKRSNYLNYIQKEWCCCTFGSRNLSENIGAQSSSNNISSNQFEILATKCKSIESISKYEEQENSDYDYNIKISLTDEVKSDDHLDDQVRSVSNRRVANKSSSIFKFRSDVVLKTIFRSFRKYFIKDFKRYYNFIYAKNKPQLFVSKVREYLIKRFGYENEEMRTIFICIIDTKQKYFQIRDDQEQILTMINSLMYNFNNDKMIELVDCVEFAKMLKAFF